MVQLLKMWKASDKPCCTVQVNLLESTLLNLASVIVSKAYFAFRPAIPPLQIGCCAMVEAYGLRSETNFAHEMGDEKMPSEIHQ
ncbi:hypothetical protein AVEN_139512-1 [Araneus ventricosus]|uniref:Uncharacterized protein n=1 Tax=Araneus ventricosus TaxID=182803 RepID=A0A4Y2IG99_ARAVE|nr:hypothetical protein AVEN_139512-1 [Araneus ventricosus]